MACFVRNKPAMGRQSHHTTALLAGGVPWISSRRPEVPPQRQHKKLECGGHQFQQAGCNSEDALDEKPFTARESELRILSGTLIGVVSRSHTTHVQPLDASRLGLKQVLQLLHLGRIPLVASRIRALPGFFAARIRLVAAQARCAMGPATCQNPRPSVNSTAALARHELRAGSLPSASEDCFAAIELRQQHLV